MPTNEEKVGKFVQAITQYAREQSSRIHNEVETYKMERLHQVEQEVLGESRQMIEKERIQMKQSLRQEGSKREQAARKMLLTRRLDMQNEVFDEAKKRLAAYTQTPAYADKLAACVKSMTEQLPVENTVFQVREADKTVVSGLLAKTPYAACAVQSAADIVLGGVRAANRPLGVLLDDTLDTRLEQQQEWFVTASGLTL